VNPSKEIVMNRFLLEHNGAVSYQPQLATDYMNITLHVGDNIEETEIPFRKYKILERTVSPTGDMTFRVNLHNKGD
jgi:hypothetical protein